MTTVDVGRLRNGHATHAKLHDSGSTGRFAMFTAPRSLRSPAVLSMYRGLGGRTMSRSVLERRAQEPLGGGKFEL